MSNMGPFGGNKNSPWGRGGVGNPAGGMVGQGTPLQQQMLNQSAIGTMGHSGMVQYQQSQQVFQAPMNIQQQNLSMGLQQLSNTPVTMNPALGQQLNPNQLFSQVGAVTYPNPRALNPNAFQTQNVPSVQNNASSTSAKQRVFTGTVTKVHDNFGFVDEDVFFQTNACVKGSNPVVGDRVLVEATFNPNMPFKWNATRIQVLPMSAPTTPLPNIRSTVSQNTSKSFSAVPVPVPNTYNAVPPPIENTNGNYMGANRNNQRTNKNSVSRTRERSRDQENDEEEIERKRRREERTREREDKDKKSPLRRRSRSPKSRRKARIVPRYMVQIPKIALHVSEADVLEIRRRYANLYVPSDFFSSNFRWIDAFPPHNPFTLNKPCSFHIMSKDVDGANTNTTNIHANNTSTVTTTTSTNVSGTGTGTGTGTGIDTSTNYLLEPSDADYLFSAKVMLMSVPTLDEIYSKCCALSEGKEKKETDGEERDFVHPTRLINFLVGLRGKNETMAIGGPWSPSLDGENPDKDPSVLIRTAIRTCRALTSIDLSNCTQWYRFVELYYRRAESTHKGKAVPARVETVVLFLPDVWSCVPTRLEWDQLHHNYRRQLERKLKTNVNEDSDDGVTADEKDDDNTNSDNKPEPTHYSHLEPKVMSVAGLRDELKARRINSKGLKSQLVARLTKALKAEAEKYEDDSLESADHADVKVDNEDKDERRKDLSDEKKLDDKERVLLEKRYALPDEQHIIVHPSRTAKSGKFDCTVMSLSLLLDYRPEDTKEHSFEVSLFAELFNEMLMRDFGFNIYRALHNLPDKPKDDKKRKDDEKKERDKKDDKDRKSDDKKKDNGRNDDDDDYDDYDDDDDDDRKDKDKKKPGDKKKKDRSRLVTKDKGLLLSFVYFDQTHCGYIFEKDIEDLIYTLGLSLSRAQVRKLVSKVITRNSLHYRKLTDKPKDEIESVTSTDSNDKSEHVEDIAYGNKRLLPVFQNERSKVDGSSADDNQLAEGFVMYQGALMDVAKLLQQLQRSEKARVDTETHMMELKSENGKLNEKNDRSVCVIKNLSAELAEYKNKLHTTEESLMRMTSCSKIFYGTFQDINEKISPLLTNSLYSDLATIEVKSPLEVKHEIIKTEASKKDNHETRWQNTDDDSTPTSNITNTHHTIEIHE